MWGPMASGARWTRLAGSTAVEHCVPHVWRRPLRREPIPFFRAVWPTAAGAARGLALLHGSQFCGPLHQQVLGHPATPSSGPRPRASPSGSIAQGTDSMVGNIAKSATSSNSLEKAAPERLKLVGTPRFNQPARETNCVRNRAENLGEADPRLHQWAVARPIRLVDDRPWFGGSRLATARRWLALNLKIRFDNQRA